jgi:hypothetical protein
LPLCFQALGKFTCQKFFISIQKVAAGRKRDTSDGFPDPSGRIRRSLAPIQKLRKPGGFFLTLQTWPLPFSSRHPTRSISRVLGNRPWESQPLARKLLILKTEDGLSDSWLRDNLRVVMSLSSGNVASHQVSYVGINIGALTVKVVALRCDDRSPRVAVHHGRPLQFLDGLLAEGEFADVRYFAVSGHQRTVAQQVCRGQR